MSSSWVYPPSGWGRTWNRHKYFGHHIGTWSEAHPKKQPSDGSGFNGVPRDFRHTWTEWRQNYDTIYSAGGPHSILGNTNVRKPPKPPVGQRASGLLEQAKIVQPAGLAPLFHGQKRSSSGFLVHPDAEEAAGQVLNAPVQQVLNRPVMSKSHQALWYYGDGGSPPWPPEDREPFSTSAGYNGRMMPGLTSSGFRRASHMSTSVNEIRF